MSGISELTVALEYAIAAVKSNHDGIPDVVLVVGGPGNGQVHGHFSPKRWSIRDNDDESTHEIMLAGESFNRGGVATFGTLVHELAHAYCDANDIQDTSNRGRYHNCFTGETKYITREGIKSFRETAGTVQEVWNGSQWVKADIREYGGGATAHVGVLLHRGTRNKDVRYFDATLNHRWIKQEGGIVTTENLSVGDLLSPARVIPRSTDDEGYRHGAVFADGAMSTNTKRVTNGFVFQLRLCGAKTKYADRFTETPTFPPSAKGDAVLNYIRRDYNMKDVPAQDATPEYKASFIEAWADFDGVTSYDGITRKITTTRRDAMEWLVENAASAGYLVSGCYEGEVASKWARNPGAPMWVVTVVPADFAWKVVSVESAGRSDKTYCAEVRGGPEQFALWNGLLTGNSNFKRIANEFGLEIEKVDTIGWSVTHVPDETVERYKEHVDAIDAAIRAYRKVDYVSKTPAKKPAKWFMACPECQDPVPIGKKWFTQQAEAPYCRTHDEHYELEQQ